MLSSLYGAAARLRRQHYASPRTRRRLARPVISIGGMTAGGSGKSPLTMAVARLLRERGERPTILSRGYKRRNFLDGVVVVSDAERVLQPVEVSGDEPQMLARALPGVPVLVSPDRFLAGRLAERRFGATVHLLDDGYQHLLLARDVDLVLVSPDDVHEQVLPMGRLREPIEAARGADALLVRGSEDEARVVGERLTHERVFSVVTRFGSLRPVDPHAEAVDLPPGSRVVAVAGIARPHRFVDALRQQGFDVVAERTFPDHHWYRPRDMVGVATAVAEAGAVAVITTEKDAARWPASGAPVPRTAYLPMELVVEPTGAFDEWLGDRLDQARASAGEKV